MYILNFLRDCGMFVVVNAEYLSNGILLPKIGFRLEYLCTQYRALLWNYGTEKA